MISYSMIIEKLVPFLNEYGIIISFLGGFLTGESIIIPLAFLSANGFLPVWYLLIFSTLGMYISDFIPLAIGKIKFFREFFEKKFTGEKAKIIEEKLYKYTHKNMFLTLLYTKFIYGTSIPTLVYLGIKKVSYTKFAIYDFFAVIVFVPVIVLIGWLGGKGFIFITTTYENVRIAIFLLIVSAIILFFVKKWVSQRLIKMPKQ